MSPSTANVLPMLIQSKLNIISLIQQITTQRKPDYSINGQSVQNAQYLRILMEQLPLINKQIQVAGGPIELQTQAIPAGGAGNGYWGGGLG